MSAEKPEAWIEVNVTAHKAPDVQLLVDVIDPLVHQELAGEIESWHFFWEPALRLRFRWRDPARAHLLADRLRGLLDARRDEGRFVEWQEGNHGEPGTYAGEPDQYGPEAWDLIQKDWMNGSELALRLIRLRGEGRLTGELTPTLEQHWGRHVHLFTNQLLGVSQPPGWWDHEIFQCLKQARGYLAASVRESGSSDYEQMLAHVDAALGVRRYP